MSIVSFEGRRNMFEHRGVKFRITNILDSSNTVQRFTIDAVFSKEQGEVRIASKKGPWNNEEESLEVAKLEAVQLIDAHLSAQ